MPALSSARAPQTQHRQLYRSGVDCNNHGPHHSRQRQVDQTGSPVRGQIETVKDAPALRWRRWASMGSGADVAEESSDVVLIGKTKVTQTKISSARIPDAVTGGEK